MSVTQLRWRGLIGVEPRDWSNQEKAEFYRISEILEKTGLGVTIDQGISDEGDPWLVFLRRETGDVLAHFARIDGLFISVSSLTGEVFRGIDARAVVDQMLQNHPLMVPRSNGNGRLFLHPSVVLTAFVAASFLLSSGDAKADSLEELISSAFTNGKSTQSLTELSTKAPTNRYEAAVPASRVNGGEDLSSSYHFAALGAILIAQKVWGSDDNGGLYTAISQVELSQVSDVLETKFPYTIVDQALAPLANREKVDAFGFLNDQLILVDEKVEDIIALKNKGIEIEGKFISLDLSGINLTSETSPLTQTDRDNFVPDHKATRIQEKIFDGIDLGEGISIENQGDNFFGKEIEVSGNKLTDFIIETKEAFEVLNSLEVFKNYITVDGIGLTVQENGDVSVVALAGNSQTDSEDQLDLLVVKATKQSEAINELVFDTGPEIDMVPPLLNPNQTETPTVINSMPKLPIIGHQLYKYVAETLVLTEATDVLFYEGGHVSVKGFDLGTDLLWFFLPADEVKYAQSEIIDGSDLWLNFGTTGTLTFLDMLTETENIDFV